MARRLHRDVQGNLVEAESVKSKAAEATNPKAAEAINPKAAEATKTGDQNGNGPLQAVQDTGMSNNAHVRDVCNHKGKDMGFSIFLSCRPCLGSVGVCFSGGRGGGGHPHLFSLDRAGAHILTRFLHSRSTLAMSISRSWKFVNDDSTTPLPAAVPQRPRHGFVALRASGKGRAVRMIMCACVA